MNKTEVVKKLMEKTSLSEAVCEKIMHEFEEESGNALANKLKGIKSDKGALVAAIAGATGYTEEDCEKVVTALDEVLDAGLSDKLRFFKKKEQ